MSVVRIESATDRDGQSVFRGIFETPGRDPVSVDFRLWDGGEAAGGTVGVFEAFTLIFLQPAMRVGDDLLVEGALDPSFLFNVDEMVRFWSRLRPERFRRITVTARDRLVPEKGTSAHGAISCFSGGVDSCHTAVTLALDGGQRFPLPLQGLCMIHGLDIPRDDTVAFESAFARSKKVADICGLGLERAWTDARKLERDFGMSWGPDFHVFPLAAVLHLFSRRYSAGIIPSTYAYDLLQLPWSSNPLSDPLLSSDRFRIAHLGAEADKFDKVSAICRHPQVARHLRVCWEGEKTDRNCGKCYKCIATQVALVLNGFTEPGPFPEVLDLARVKRLALKTEVNRKLFERYRVEAGRRDLNDLEVALQECLKVNKDVAGYARKGRRLRRLMKKIRRWRKPR